MKERKEEEKEKIREWEGNRICESGCKDVEY